MSNKFAIGDVLLIKNHKGNLLKVVDQPAQLVRAVCVGVVIFGPRIDYPTYYWDIKESDLDPNYGPLTDKEIEAFKILHA